MPISEAEQRDLDEMHAQQAKIMDNFFSYARHLDRMSDETLKHAGYGGKSKDYVIANVFRNKVRELDALVTKHLKKWPD